MLNKGDDAPDFTLRDQGGKEHTLSQYRGKKVVLYFYPKDETPGCTVEACNFRDSYEDIKARNAVILGVSADSVQSHGAFSKNHHLQFPLLSDPEKKVIAQYGALRETGLFKKTFLGVLRSTYIIDETGKILKVFPNVNASAHSMEVLEALG